MEEEAAPEPESEIEDYEEQHLQPAAVVINTPSTGRKIRAQLSDDLFIETEMPFEEDFKENLSFVVSETIRLADRILIKNAQGDMMIR